MRETSKAHPLRLARGDYDRYLKGDGMDIGAGDDPLAIPNGNVIYWDLPQGDAQYLASVPDASLDFVFSSHCLEHMRSVETALTSWRRVLRGGGHAYVLVPDYTLYEQHAWPSRYNHDHKHSFSLWLSREKVYRENHWHISGPAFGAILQVSGFEKVEAELQDQGLDYSAGPGDQTLGPALAQILIVLIAI